MTTKKTISYGDELEEIIDAHVEAGIAKSRSDWFQQAGYAYLSLLELAVDTADASSAEEVHDVYAAIGNMEVDE